MNNNNEKNKYEQYANQMRNALFLNLKQRQWQKLKSKLRKFKKSLLKED